MERPSPSAPFELLGRLLLAVDVSAGARHVFVRIPGRRLPDLGKTFAVNVEPLVGPTEPLVGPIEPVVGSGEPGAGLNERVTGSYVQAGTYVHAFGTHGQGVGT